MNIKHSIGLNLSADAIPGRLHMVQGDSNSRTIVATLWDGAQLYSIPTGAAVMVRFRKPDGTGGLYDASESGQKVSYTGSIVTAPVATQMLAVAGDVFAEIDIFGGGAGAAAERLATFRFVVEVAPCVLPDAEIISSDYYNVLAADIADAKAAADQAKAYAAAAKKSADSAAMSVEGAVKYNTPQTLTDEQKQQARDNIGAPAPYTAGENISISGSVIATKAFPCNPNLLDNWYFGNPVNQRGQTSYTGAGYGIDRWKANAVTPNVTTIKDGYIELSQNALIEQTLEEPYSLCGKQVTASTLLTTGLYTFTATIPSKEELSAVTADKSLGSAYFVLDGKNVGYIDMLHTKSHSTVLRLRAFGGYTVGAIAAKLELGSQQTLAHQENGVWVLNEMPNYGEQLRRCQRYYWRTVSPGVSAYATIGSGIATSAHADIVVPLPASMRDKPVAICSSLADLAIQTGVTSYNATGVQIVNASPSACTLRVAITGLTVGAAVIAYMRNSAYVEFSADL